MLSQGELCAHLHSTTQVVSSLLVTILGKSCILARCSMMMDIAIVSVECKMLNKVV